LLGAGKLPAQHLRKTLDTGQDAVMGDERFRQWKPRGEIWQRQKGNARLFAAPERLIETKQDGLGRLLGMEPPFEARAWQIVELANALQAEPPQETGDLGRKAQGLDRKGRKREIDLSIGNDDGGSVRVAGECMCPAQGLGKSKPRREPCAGEPPHEIGKKRAFASEEMRHAADIEPEPVGAVGIQRGAIAAGRPAGEFAKGRFILLWRGWKREKAGTGGAGIGKAKTGGEALARARFVERGDEESPLFATD
jgi:hypothetical protein